MSNSSIGNPVSKSGASAVTELTSANTLATDTTPVAYTDGVGNLSVSITPSSASSKILILVTMTVDHIANVIVNTILNRNGSPLFVGDAAGSRAQATFGSFGSGAAAGMAGTFAYLDSPASTSAQTYSIDIMTESARTLYINRAVTDTDNNFNVRATSRIIVLEILP